MNKNRTIKLGLLPLGLLGSSAPAWAMGGEVAREIAQAAGLNIYHATRKDDNFYDIAEGYVVKTKYCYTYATYADVVILNKKIFFLSEDESCDIDGIYRK